MSLVGEPLQPKVELVIHLPERFSSEKGLGFVFAAFPASSVPLERDKLKLILGIRDKDGALTAELVELDLSKHSKDSHVELF